MTVQLNHTIVMARHKEVSARFLTEILGLPGATRFGPFRVVEMDNGVSLDFYETDGEIASQHYAFLITEAEFDEIFARIRERNLEYWADPGQSRAGEINQDDGGRGVYFEDPNGHLPRLSPGPMAAAAWLLSSTTSTTGMLSCRGGSQNSTAWRCRERASFCVTVI